MVRHYGAVPNVTDLRPGDPEEIAGYHVVSRLGAGGQGVVYLATAPNGEKVAIKQLKVGPHDDRARQQLAKEVAAARLVAPFCTAQVLDADLDGPSPYVVSEYIDGLSLQQRIEQRGPLTGAALQRMAIATATALAAIHQAGVVHRDFKPANVMLAYDGPRVIDFGIARDLSTDTTVTSRVFGTPAYMAPEQLAAERIGPATDMFAWASVIAFAGTGRAPFEAPHMMAVVHRITSGEPDLTGVSPELAVVLQRCLNKDPAGRPTAQQVLALLLGRTAPANDSSDATQVLAEASGIVHAQAAAAATTWGTPQPTMRDGLPPVPPSYVRPGSDTAPGPGPSERPKRGRTLAVAAVVAALVVGLGTAWAFDQGPFADQDQTSSASPSAGADDPVGAESPDPTEPSITETPSSEVTTDDATGGNNGDGGDDGEEDTVPEDFDGTWKGVGFQPSGAVKTWDVEVKLREGKTRGTMKLPELDCSGDLTVTSASDNVLELDAVMDKDPDGVCADAAQVRLTRLPFERLTFQWEDSADSTNTASGVLQKD